MSKYVFVKRHDNWADEMDLDGFALMLESDWQKFVVEWDSGYESDYDDEGEPKPIPPSMDESGQPLMYERVVAEYRERCSQR